jgi:hypothetical protein
MRTALIAVGTRTVRFAVGGLKGREVGGALCVAGGHGTRAGAPRGVALCGSTRFRFEGVVQRRRAKQARARRATVAFHGFVKRVAPQAGMAWREGLAPADAARTARGAGVFAGGPSRPTPRANASMYTSKLLLLRRRAYLGLPVCVDL